MGKYNRPVEKHTVEKYELPLWVEALLVFASIAGVAFIVKIIMGVE
jgi:hypothetical protein